MKDSAKKSIVQGDDVHLLLAALPAEIQTALRKLAVEQLVEVVMDLGRPPLARLAEETVKLGDQPVDSDQLAHVLALVGEFSDDNRAGIERTLHRISGIRNRKGQIIGLTLRVGRAVFGGIELLRDLIETGQSILILGRPGVGKTTKLREMARVLADDVHKRVIVIDTSNEIAGDGDIPHPGIGSARRMQVPRPDRQHAVMIEAVENHMPEVIIVDEIGTEAEAAAARTIAERGVQLIGTAHGNSLENLIINPTLSDLVGGVQTVTLSDEEARRRRTTKTVSERRSPPTFDIVVEMEDRDELIIHRDTGAAVDAILRGFAPQSQRREQSANGAITVAEHRREPSGPPPAQQLARREGPLRIYPYALSRDLLERVIRSLGIDARTVGTPEQADLVLALRSRSEDFRLKRAMEEGDASLHLLKRNTANEMRRMLQQAFNIIEGIEDDEVQEVVTETEAAIDRVLHERKEVALTPRRPALRKMQHRIIAGSRLTALSCGREPERHLVIYPLEEQA
ncbi:R3H domain-containing nucleic acid-binding protein [Geobacter sp. DSM 9736]|uniref:R3H domain-containing nucleic acid-binding protein n=1 Tax=Geobacter sp. DSM 9736 TaxID=1277350 RepID=UPI000B5094BA|nr:R3H domain-containing nucleic acid-binding protein [Geobacter sp. DSM 9736]SNB46580.1 Stage III sporulation protein SpoIIIAA [Geobacter sp. DSM 9736]